VATGSTGLQVGEESNVEVLGERERDNGGEDDRCGAAECRYECFLAAVERGGGHPNDEEDECIRDNERDDGSVDYGCGVLFPVVLDEQV